ncbi:beta-ketoacyl-ACP synthase II [Lyticum sinuosum]|uniref:3-oxoacyl-[acyl-carrier-protein] synthase 2 n=1 Tax=Lyticum sinuosum TaxID=1332059 RepID=A0AAE5AGZ8_9RICK|nr:beta-ketoacyl-ACP synthase II [Lyticum sinuosum]MDZ5760980.1 3-oxoacyl-[acyl-carrier-protein] synthase 2 [Lyticum sinuosum]
MRSTRKVVITGVGLITPLSIKTEKSWEKIINGESGIKSIPSTLFPLDDLPCKIAGYIPDKKNDSENGFSAEDWLSSKEIKSMDRFIQLAMVATKQAVEDSCYTPDTYDKKIRSGVLVGSGIGGLISIECNSHIIVDRGPRRVSPFFIPSSLINLTSGHISIKYGYKGVNFSIVSACATGAHCIGEAARIIACNDADVMIAGGTEAAISYVGFGGFTAAKALSTNYNHVPTQASRPWDKGRDGFVMGEGAGIVILEEYEHAKARNAKIYGEIIGYGLSSDAYHITAPDETGDGAYRAMKMALDKAGINAAEIDYINAHGTSTPIGDMVELKAMRNIYKNQDYRPIISSTKSSIGHLLGASGSVEAIFSLLSMRDNIIPPTLNLNDPEENTLDFDLCPNVAKKAKLNYVMSNSFGFGGTNSSLIFKKI